MLRASDADIINAVDRLKALRGTVTKGDFKIHEQAAGFTHYNQGLLQDPTLRGILRPASQFYHDWMHALASSGVCQVVIHLFIGAFATTKIGEFYNFMHTYLQEWHWQTRLDRKNVADLFVKKRLDSNKRAKTFKANASEIMSFFPILAFYVAAIALPSGKCNEACLAVLILADVLELLQLANRQPAAVLRPLRGAIRSFLRKCEAAGWKKQMMPKFHWLVHLPTHLERFSCLPTCWVHERKHRVAKRYASDIKNTGIY